MLAFVCIMKGTFNLESFNQESLALSLSWYGEQQALSVGFFLNFLIYQFTKSYKQFLNEIYFFIVIIKAGVVKFINFYYMCWYLDEQIHIVETNTVINLSICEIEFLHIF